MVVKGGFSRSIHNLHNLELIHFSQRTTILIFLIIKIFPAHHCQHGTRVMVAMLYLRTNAAPKMPVSVISFGNAQLNNLVVRFIQNTEGTKITDFITEAPPCNSLNIPNYILNIPANALFNDAGTLMGWIMGST
ncbi:hypothetical protein C1645_809828 [Glomus cerebriforme]|uniref:Uncharacterized protein n=1 Tax=Glomus cerebriforme TaxID=658196 RepID=A0A397SGR5_9GLOM|nr:hypothetical protein C1645_809828 [Glomus cerebriforme]